MSREKAYFNTKMCLFYIGHKICWFSVKQLREYKAYYNLCENIYFQNI